MTKYIPGMVSVITPTFNRGEWLYSRWLELQEQTYQNWEWIIVDDGSTDKESISTLAGMTDDRIRKIYLPRNSMSVTVPRNVGISHSRGEFLAHADDDVEQSSRKLELLVKALNSNPDAVMAYGGRYQRKKGEGKELCADIDNWNPKLGWGVDNGQYAYRASVYETKPLIFSNNACDWHTAKHICDLGRIVQIKEPVCTYIWHEGNRSSNRPKVRVDPRCYAEFFTDKFPIDWRVFE